MSEKQAWDRQWRGHVLSTCGHHADPKAGRKISLGWKEFFKTLPGHATILDIGTGNGILPLMAVEVSQKLHKDFEIHGADQAAVNPVHTLPEFAPQLERVVFHPETPTERLPFQDKAFDAVTGQHALEYGDIEKSVTEVSRVLKEDGHMRFLMHAGEGEIVGGNLCKIEQCRYLLEEAKIFTSVKTAVEKALAGDPEAGAALKAVLDKTRQRFTKDPAHQDLFSLLDLLWDAFEHFRAHPDRQALARWTAENRAETEAQMVRIEALRDAAVKEGEARRIAELFEGKGHPAHAEPVTDNGTLLGWLVEG